MAIPAVPVISDLPSAPTRSDGAADFTPKADAMIGALQPMVVQVNIALQWMNGRLTDTQAAQGAAASSASNAASSASAAANSATAATTNGAEQVQLAADQVGLAVTARQGAEAALASNQVVAAAVQASAGMPSFEGHDAFDVLQINSAKTGVQWGKVGQSVGDVLQSVANPGALYLPADGSIYLKSAYPLLAAAVGTIGEKNFAATFSSVSAGFGSNSINGIACGKDGVFIAAGAGVLARSTNGGATWTTITGVGLTSNFRSIATDKNGVWVAGTDSAQAYRSTDNGLTWAAISVSPSLPNGNMVSIATDRLGVWIIIQDAATGHYRSTNNGASFTQVNSGIPGAGLFVETDGQGTWLIITSASPSPLARSDDGGVTWTYATRSGSSAFLSPHRIVTDRKGTWVATSTDRTLLISKDKGVSWAMTGLIAAQLCVSSSGIWVAGTTAGGVFRSSDLLEWKISASGLGSATVNALCCDDSGNFLAGTATGVMTRSVPAYFYDTSTQFRVPKLAANGPVIPYIKSKVA